MSINSFGGVDIQWFAEVVCGDVQRCRMSQKFEAIFPSTIPPLGGVGSSARARELGAGLAQRPGPGCVPHPPRGGAFAFPIMSVSCMQRRGNAACANAPSLTFLACRTSSACSPALPGAALPSQSRVLSGAARTSPRPQSPKDDSLTHGLLPHADAATCPAGMLLVASESSWE